jgi:hypothetical protein
MKLFDAQFGSVRNGYLKKYLRIIALTIIHIEANADRLNNVMYLTENKFSVLIMKELFEKYRSKQSLNCFLCVYLFFPSTLDLHQCK